MKIRLRVLLCMVPVSVASMASADVIEMDLGRFKFNGGVEDYVYEGAYGKDGRDRRSRIPLQRL